MDIAYGDRTLVSILLAALVLSLGVVKSVKVV